MKSYGQIFRNLCWNFSGMAIPIIIALIAIPVLLRYLGPNRFGILAIAWAVLGYFSLFDFGVGRATTRYLSASIKANNDPAYIRDLVWNSFLVHLTLGLIGGTILSVISNWIIYHQFNIPAELLSETRDAFYFLAISIPALVTTSCLRGVLESLYRFDLINIIKIPASTLNFLIPIVILLFTNNLSAIVGTISVCRYFVLLAYLIICIREYPLLKSKFKINADIIRKLFGFGVWITISSLITPLILFADRFTIASIFSIKAVTYYVVPYEVTTKLWIFSASLLGVLFPIFSASNDSSEIRKLSKQALIFFVVFVVPLCALLIGFGREILELWINEDLAMQSGTVMKWLALGVLVNVLAQIPYTALQASDRPDIVAKLQLLELPVYVALMLYLSNIFGTVGIAMAWFIRALFDGLLLQAVAVRLIGFRWMDQNIRNTVAKILPIILFIGSIWFVEKICRQLVYLKFTIIPFLFSIFVFWMIKFLIGSDFFNEHIGKFLSLLRQRLASR